MRWIVLALVGCGSTTNPAREAIDAQRARGAAEDGWTCPMHPEVHAVEPGTCSVCGMPLAKAGG